MESTIYQDSPLADYLEGQGVAQQGWNQVADSHPHDLIDVPTFAPHGPPLSIRTRIQDALQSSRHLSASSSSRAWNKLQDACSAAIASGISKAEHERFLEQFRYLIIASQLLVEQSKPASLRSVGANAGSNLESNTFYSSALETFSLKGVIVTATASFLVAWTLNWFRARSSTFLHIHWQRLSIVVLLLAILVASLYSYARRKTVKRVRTTAMSNVSALISASHALDGVANTAFTLVQEVEIVARGYEISSPLPPVTRLDESSEERRCSQLRQILGTRLLSLTNQYIESHGCLQSFTDAGDMQRYHDIYELSRHDFLEVISDLAEGYEGDRDSLRSLRYSFKRLFIARKIVLCDLLALPAVSSHPDMQKWSAISEEIRLLADMSNDAVKVLSAALVDEDNKQWGGQARAKARESLNIGSSRSRERPVTPGKSRVMAQMRRLDSIFQGIRALHAKMLLLREEADALVEASEDSTEMSPVLVKQHDAIGSDLRSLLAEWERGRQTMYLSVDRSHDRVSSCSSSGLKTPMSPAFSASGATAVEGESPGPAEALKLLIGESISQTASEQGVLLDDEVFEAVAFSPKQALMTREEKLAKMKQDRRKRATLQERTEANTHMLRELETVIKHRPRGRTTSRYTSM